MKYKYVLFDADDTLLDFKLAEHTAISQVFSEVGLPCDDETIAVYSRINDSLWKLLELGGITKEKLKTERFRLFCEQMNISESPEKMAEMYVDRLAKQSFLLPCAEAVCKKIYDEGIKIYIITNGIKYIQTERLSATPIKKYFSGVFISEDVGYEKPNVEYFKYVFSKIENFDPAEAIVVGDSLTSDIKGGINAGIDTCWYNPHGKSKPENMQICYEISDITQVYSILEI